MDTSIRYASIALHVVARGVGVLLLVYLTLGSLVAAQSSQDQEKDKEPLKVKFTGALFGYYRIEADEDPASPKLTVVDSLLKNLQDGVNARDKAGPSSRSLLLGMGDNYSPEFGASVQQEFKSLKGDKSPCSVPAPAPHGPAAAGKWSLFAPETLYKSEDRMPALANCDNVTGFLMTAGYRAIVPGREDFIYSATWLRRIAILLRGASDSSLLGGNPFPDPSSPKGRPWNFGTIENKDGQLQLLAANIRVSTTDPKKKAASGAAKEGPKPSCPLLFSLDLAAGPECATGDSSISAEMDWLLRIDQTLPQQTSPQAPAANATNGSLDETRRLVEEALTSRAKQNSQFRRQLLTNQVAIISSLLDGFECPKLLDLDKFSEAETAIDKTNPETDSSSDKYRSNEATTWSTLKTYVETVDSDSLRKFPQTCRVFSVSAGDGAYLKDADLLVQVVQALENTLHPLSDKSAASQNALLPYGIRESILRLFLHLIAREQRDVGYTIATQPNHKRVLIVGVVGKETMKEITHDYFTVYPDTNDCSMGAQTVPLAVCDDRKEVLKRRDTYLSNIPDAKHKDLRTAFELNVGDPRTTVTTILRAAWAAREAGMRDSNFDYVVVMAQMPHSEADELGAHVRMDLSGFHFDCTGTGPNCLAPHIDLILSEAQDGHETGNLEAGIEPGGQTQVLTPFPAYRRFSRQWSHGSVQWFRDPNPISTATLLETKPVFAQVTHILQNRIDTQKDPDINLEGNTAASLLVERFKGYQSASDLTFAWDQCATELAKSTCQNSVLMQYLLRTLQRSANSDIALLKRRDFYFEALPAEYVNYDVCNTWFDDHNSPSLPNPGKRERNTQDEKSASDYCRLHVALDRVLWKGDYSERIMVDGTTLTGLMTTAQKQTDLEQTLLPSDLHQEWLVPYGIVTEPPTNLAAAAAGPETFTVAGNPGCANQTASDPSQGPQIPYCVDGLNIAADHSYWVTTSNQLAEDNTTYSSLGALSAQNPSPAFAPPELFITTEIAREVTLHRQPNVLREKPKDNQNIQASLSYGEMLQQNRRLFQLDFSKVVAGFTMTEPTLPDAIVGSDFAGVSNTQAQTPHSQELDLEAAGRLISSPWRGRFVFGVQNDAEYDRKVAGNVNGNPETVTYPSNGLTVGPFAQIQLHTNLIPGLARVGIQQSTRNLPRAFLVIAPFQFQRQFNGTFVPFAYYTPDASLAPGAGTTSKTQFNTIQLPTAMGFSQRMGLRIESSSKWYFDPGSYVELGPEYTVLNNVLYQLLLPQLPAPYNVCAASASTSFTTCVKNSYLNSPVQVSLNASSSIVPVPKTLHAGGLYWMAHVQKNIDEKKNYSVSFDTSGDEFMVPGLTLSSETRYAFSTKLAINFKIIPNLSLSPTYATFFFENQAPHLQRQSVVDNTFTITAKWYFARDSAVPFRKQMIFAGPASTDQTTSAKIK
jgi:hypothetical protein